MHNAEIVMMSGTKLRELIGHRDLERPAKEVKEKAADKTVNAAIGKVMAKHVCLTTFDRVINQSINYSIYQPRR